MSIEESLDIVRGLTEEEKIILLDWLLALREKRKGSSSRSE